MKVEEVLAQIAQQLEDYRTCVFPTLKRSLETEVEKLKDDPKLYQDTQKFIEVVDLLIKRDVTSSLWNIEQSLTGTGTLNPPNPSNQLSYYLRPLLMIQDQPGIILSYASSFFNTHKQEVERFEPLQTIRQAIFRTLEALQQTIQKGIQTAQGTAAATRIAKDPRTARPWNLRKKEKQINLGEYQVQQGNKTLTIPKHIITIEARIDFSEFFPIGDLKSEKDLVYYFDWAKSGCPLIEFKNARCLPEEINLTSHDYTSEQCEEIILNYVIEQTEIFLRQNPSLLRSQTVRYTITLSPKGKQEKGFIGQYLPIPSTFSCQCLGINTQYFLPEVLNQVHPNSVLKDLVKEVYSYTQTLAHELGHTFDIHQLKFGVESMIEAHALLKTSELTPSSYFVTWILQILRQEGLAEFSRHLYSTKRIPLMDVPWRLYSAKYQLAFGRDRPPQDILQFMRNQKSMNDAHDSLYVPGLYMVALLFITRQTRAGIPSVIREKAGSNSNLGGAILSFDKMGEALEKKEPLYVVLEPRSICEQFLTKLSLMPLERFVADYNEACAKLQLPNTCFFPELRPFLREVEDLGRAKEEERRQKFGLAA